jgi:hypothetical protein
MTPAGKAPTAKWLNIFFGLTALKYALGGMTIFGLDIPELDATLGAAMVALPGAVYAARRHTEANARITEASG